MPFYLNLPVFIGKSPQKLFEFSLRYDLHSGRNKNFTHVKVYNDLQERLPHIAEELRQSGVTRWLLWREYLGAQAQGYRYSQFCEHLMRYLSKQGLP